MNFSEFFSLSVAADIFKNHLNTHDWALIRAALGEPVDLAELRRAASHYSTHGLLAEYFLPGELAKNIWNPKNLFKDLESYEWLVGVLSNEDLPVNRNGEDLPVNRNGDDLLENLHEIINDNVHVVDMCLEVFIRLFVDFPEIADMVMDNLGDDYLSDEKVEYIISEHSGTIIDCFIETAELRHRYASTIDWQDQETRRRHYGLIELKYCWRGFQAGPHEEKYIGSVFGVDDFEDYCAILLNYYDDIHEYAYHFDADINAAIRYAIRYARDRVVRDYWVLASMWYCFEVISEHSHLAGPTMTGPQIGGDKRVFSLAYRLHPEQTRRLIHDNPNRIPVRVIDWLVDVGAQWDMKTRELAVGFSFRGINAEALPSVEVLREYYYYSDASSAAARELASQYRGTHSDIMDYLELGFRENIFWLRKVATTSKSSQERIYALKRLLDLESLS